MLRNQLFQLDLKHPRIGVALAFVMCLLFVNTLGAEEPSDDDLAASSTAIVDDQKLAAEELVSPQRISSSLQIVCLRTRRCMVAVAVILRTLTLAKNILDVSIRV